MATSQQLEAWPIDTSWCSCPFIVCRSMTAWPPRSSKAVVRPSSRSSGSGSRMVQHYIRGMVQHCLEQLHLLPVLLLRLRLAGVFCVCVCIYISCRQKGICVCFSIFRTLSHDDVNQVSLMIVCEQFLHTLKASSCMHTQMTHRHSWWCASIMERTVQNTNSYKGYLGVLHSGLKPHFWILTVNCHRSMTRLLGLHTLH